MTADNCIYWQGEGCACELIEGFSCSYATKEICSQCTATNEDLEEIGEAEE